MDIYAVFGNPIAQSKSPDIHLQFAKQAKQQLEYAKILGSIEDFAGSLSEFFDCPEAKGCNVTAPFKQEAAKWVDSLSPSAEFGDAVNTIIRNRDGTFAGDNTDGIGLVKDILANGVEIKGLNVLLLGAGGAARGVLQQLAKQKPSSILIANRTAGRAVALANLLNVPSVQGIELSAAVLSKSTIDFDIIINSTSASLSNKLPDLPDGLISSARVVYDMVYGKELSPFLQHANHLGVTKVIDGLGMLVEQAAESFYLWTGVRPDTKEVLHMLRNQI